MFKNFNLKTKIISSIAVASLFLCIVISVIIYFYLDKNLVDEKLKNINKLNIEQVHESQRIFEKGNVFAKVLSENVLVKDYLSSPTEKKRIDLSKILLDHTKEDNQFLSLYLLNKNGIALISTDPTFVGQDYSFRDYYKEGMKGTPTIDLLLGKTSNQFGYYFSYPVFDDKKNVLGIFISKINNKEIDSAILNSEVAKESSVMLVDKYGIVVVSSKPDRFLKSLGNLNKDELSFIKNSKKFLDKEILPLQYNDVQVLIREGGSTDGIRINDKEDGETEILNINKVGEFPFYLVSETGLETINSTIIKIILILLLLMILGVIFSSFIIYRLLIKAISPLKELEVFAKDISKGDLSKRVNIKTKDEFGNLAQSFNKMADSLSDLYENLGKKVKERTEKLEESENVLKKTLADAERVNKLMVGRELEMMKLKKEIMDIKNNK